MLPRRFPRGVRIARPPPVPQIGYMEYHEAQESLLPSLMERRLQSWGEPGNEIDPQLDCILYNGRIPQEITDLIFEYVLSADAFTMNDSPRKTPLHDFCLRNDHKPASDEPQVRMALSDGDQAKFEADSDGRDQSDTIMPQQSSMEPLSVQSRGLLVVRDRKGRGFDWFRPGCNHKPTYSGWIILQTCRRIYLEAAKLLARNRTVVVFEGRGPVDEQSFADLTRRARNAYSRPDFQQIPCMHMYSQMYRLERAAETFKPPQTSRALPGISGNDETANDAHWHLRSLLAGGGSPPEPVWRILHNLEVFHLTLRRTDWDRWEDNKALSINPYRGNSATPHLGEMKRDMHAAMVEGVGLQFEKTAWGRMFHIMANLKGLSITFETSEDKQDEMEEIVEWARTWRFEIMSWRHWMLRNNEEVVAHLLADSKPVRKTSWRGLRYHWSDSCPTCSTSISEPKNDCPYCRKREVLLRDGKGPRLLTWTRVWRRQPVEPFVDLKDRETRPDQGNESSRRNSILP